MKRKRVVVGFLLLVIWILSGCTETITDKVTEKKIKVIEKVDPSLTEVEVETDGMLASFVYDGPDPFGIGNKVLADMNYYKQNDIARGDIVVFSTKNKKNQDTDMARVVGLPGETVRIDKGQVYIDDKMLDTFYGNDSTSENNDSWDPVTLKDGEYYILADVRWRGFNDSQTAGPFRKEDILGKILGYKKR
ncbi:signal peptidase I [Cohnella candidum]|uniref:Signal peptidase I n=1 Tax=Cohnella candidum TaxID=2674991 RepID=A0A3G3JY31_9BACL|nr:signal peptidase I [Cohnella candidum]AYQ72757.1 signal peptidase I [Cohnella candidum]